MSSGVRTDLLALYDWDERFSATYPDSRREELPGLVRHVDLLGTSSTVLYSRLTSETAEAAIQDQVAYFTSLGHDFEWKVYAHDEPADLAARLAARGFSIDETETVLVLDLHTTSSVAEAQDRVRRVATRGELRDVTTVRRRVYPGRDVDKLEKRLAFELEHTPDGFSVYVAYVDGAPAACAWIRFPQSSAFASLWGGSTVPEIRNHGLYTELLQVRIQAAAERGFRYLTVDARSTSRPILQKRGFQVLAFATPCTRSLVRG